MEGESSRVAVPRSVVLAVAFVIALELALVVALGTAAAIGMDTGTQPPGETSVAEVRDGSSAMRHDVSGAIEEDEVRDGGSAEEYGDAGAIAEIDTAVSEQLREQTVEAGGTTPKTADIMFPMTVASVVSVTVAAGALYVARRRIE